jgi:hypothetical protein
MSLAVPVSASECTADVRRLAEKYGIPTRHPTTKRLIETSVLCDHLKWLTMNPTKSQLRQQQRSFATNDQERAEQIVISLHTALKRLHEMRGGSGAGKHAKGPFCGPAGGAPPGTFPVTNSRQAASALGYSHNAPRPSGIRKCVDLVEKYEFKVPRGDIDGLLAQAKLHKKQSKRRTNRRKSGRKSGRKSARKSGRKSKPVDDDAADDDAELMAAIEENFASD